MSKPGAKFDGGKLQYELLPPEPIEQIVAILTFGALKYEPNNWQNIPDGTERYYASLMRHLAEFRKGETHDPDSGMHHLAHAGCCIIFMLWFEREDCIEPESPLFKDLMANVAERWAAKRAEAGFADGGRVSE